MSARDIILPLGLGLLAAWATTALLLPRFPSSKPSQSPQSPNKTLQAFPSRWISAWLQTDPAVFASLWSPTGRFTDHAYQFTSFRHPALSRHFAGWRGAHDSFDLWLDEEYPVYWADVDNAKGDGKCSFRVTGKGWGPVSIVVDMWIEGGKLVSVDEWYRDSFGSAVRKGEYQVREVKEEA
jgi:hypothetical protein